jgi:ATP-dependent exoDNAse (exonuclease V) alpha subunit
MALDPAAFMVNYAKAHQLARLDRQSPSDTLEAKANIIVERILASGTEIIEEVESLEDPLKEEAKAIKQEVVKSTLIPPREVCGLSDPSITLDPSQEAAINMLVSEQYGCLIGAAGSGKTTVTKYLLEKIVYGDEELGISPRKINMLTGKQGLSIALCAFTGIATQVIKQNMPEWLHPACKTIHSLLEYAPVITEVAKPDGSFKETKIFMPSRHAANKFDYDIIIVDEASMVGVDLWHQILDAARSGTTIILIGDLNQLPPVTSHSMFAHALAAWPVAELTKIHRQKEPAANRIIETAHAVLQGKKFGPEWFDDPKTNPNWRVIGFELPADPMKAGANIIAIANQLRTRTVHPSIDPTEPLIYDPYRDRIITAGNGFDENNTASAIQQLWINEALANMIEPPTPDHPRYVIEIDRGGFKRFAVNHRVMATKNEAPDVENRVTNGMVGVITKIERNPAWSGDATMVGPEHLVLEAKKARAERILYGKDDNSGLLAEFAAMDFGNLNLSSENLNGDGEDSSDEVREGGGPASHRVEVLFANGASRIFSNKTQVGALQLAYASTCHKCQGSQMDTAIVVVHHIVKGQLSREWLYTAITRAQKRVILLYTDFGMRTAIAKQKIFGVNLAEKVKRYQALQAESLGALKTRVRLYI